MIQQPRTCSDLLSKSPPKISPPMPSHSSISHPHLKATPEKKLRRPSISNGLLADGEKGLLQGMIFIAKRKQKTANWARDVCSRNSFSRSSHRAGGSTDGGPHGIPGAKHLRGPAGVGSGLGSPEIEIPPKQGKKMSVWGHVGRPKLEKHLKLWENQGQ